MIKNIAWNTFKKTGDINTYLEFKMFKNIEENFVKENLNGTIEGKRNSYSGK